MGLTAQQMAISIQSKFWLLAMLLFSAAVALFFTPQLTGAFFSGGYFLLLGAVLASASAVIAQAFRTVRARSPVSSVSLAVQVVGLGVVVWAAFIFFAGTHAGV